MRLSGIDQSVKSGSINKFICLISPKPVSRHLDSLPAVDRN